MIGLGLSLSEIAWRGQAGIALALVLTTLSGEAITDTYGNPLTADRGIEVFPPSPPPIAAEPPRLPVGIYELVDGGGINITDNALANLTFKVL